jgi:hypothetical protein
MTPASTAPSSVRPIRTITLCVLPAQGGYGILTLTVGKQVADYFVARLASDFGLGFALEKIGGDVHERYHVHLDAGDRSACECLGFLRHGRCKHLAGLRTLVRAGVLTAETASAAAGTQAAGARTPLAPVIAAGSPPRWRSSGDFAANDPDGARAANDAWANEWQMWSRTLSCVACHELLAACTCLPPATTCPGCRQPSLPGQRTCGRYACVQAYDDAPSTLGVRVLPPHVARVLAELRSALARRATLKPCERELDILHQAALTLGNLIPRVLSANSLACAAGPRCSTAHAVD